MAPMKSPPRKFDPDLAGTLSIARVAARWHMPQKEVRRLLGDQVLEFVQVRGKFRIPREEVTRYERRRAAK